MRPDASAQGAPKQEPRTLPGGALPIDIMHRKYPRVRAFNAPGAGVPV